MKKINVLLAIFFLTGNVFADTNFTVQNGSNTYLTVIGSSGNVGIDSANPGQNLDVAGTVRAQLFTGQGALGKLILYASQEGCALNSNILTGGGTDDTNCIQKGLNAITNNPAGGEWIQDGVSLISNVNVVSSTHNPIQAGDQTTALEIGSNTRLHILPGAGFFLKAQSDCTMLGNLITGQSGANYQPYIEVDGGTWNANGANQDICTLPWDGNDHIGCEKNVATNWIVTGFWFGTASYLNIHDLTIANVPGYQMYFTNDANIILKNIVESEDGSLTSNGQDGFHFGGNTSNVYGENLSNNGNDDTITFNTDEEYNWGQTLTGAFGLGRFPQSNTMDTVENVVFKDVFFNTAADGLRFYDVNVGTGPSIDNAYFYNMYGTIASVAMHDEYSHLKFGKLVIDGWTINGQSAITVGGKNDTDDYISLKNLNFVDYDNANFQPINIVGGSGQVTVSGVTANATSNTGTANQIFNLAFGSQNIAIANITSTNFSSLLSGFSSSSDIVTLSNIIPSNYSSVLVSGFSVASISGDYNIKDNVNGNVFITSGNLGVGVTTPGKLLDVAGTVRAIGFTMSGQTPTTGYVLTSSDSSGDAIWSPSTGGSGSNYWTTANVGIGTTNNVSIGTTANNNTLTVKGTANFTGNVSIGSTSASQNLFVNGSSQFGGISNAANISSGGILTFSGSAYYGVPSNTYAFESNAFSSAGIEFISDNATFGRVSTKDISANEVLAVDVVNDRVGINNASPGTALDVTGEIRSSDWSGATTGTILCKKASGGIGYCATLVGVVCTSCS